MQSTAFAARTKESLVPPPAAGSALALTAARKAPNESAQHDHRIVPRHITSAGRERASFHAASTRE
jgi:hypothetical protein